MNLSRPSSNMSGSLGIRRGAGARGTFPNTGAAASPLLRLAHVFDVVWKPQPRMLPLLPDRPRRRREGRIRERAYRDGHNSRRGLRGVEDGRAAVRTEVEEGAFLSLV